MTRDDILEHLFVTRRALTVFVAQTAQHVVEPALVRDLLAQRDHVVWLINRIVVSEVLASIAGAELSVATLIDSTTKLEHLKATADDITKALDIAKSVVSAAGALSGHVL